MLFKSSFLALAALGTAVLASPAEQKATTTATVETFTTVAVSQSSQKPSGSLTISNINTVNQYGMTVLNLAFANPKNASMKSACAITMTHRSENDLCSPQSYNAWTISVLRHGLNGDWPMDIYLSYEAENGQYASKTFTLVSPADKKSGLSCSTAGGATTCKHTKLISVPLMFQQWD